MTSFARKLALVAVLAAALPAAARAQPCDDHRPVAVPAYPPPPAPAAWRDGDRDREGWRDHRRAEWRERELRELRAEFRALEDERASFHARFGWNRRRVARFERSYAERRAELQRRWDALQQYAWR